MTVKELIEALQKLPDQDAKVVCDFDREGGNEDEITRIEPYDRHGFKGAYRIGCE